jgi:uncharacterized protein YegL
MRGKLSSVVLGISLLACAKKSQDAGRMVTADEGRPAAPEAYRTETAKDVAPSGASAGSAAAPSDLKADKPSPSMAVGGAGGAQGQLASVRAGEWDDNANYRDYAKWIRAASKQIARLDIENRQFVVVEDSDGKPVPNCKLAVSSGQKSAALVTMASGRALVFPHAFGLSGDLASVTATCGQAIAKGELSLNKTDGVTQLKLASQRALPARRTIDLAFVLDTTGSMGEEIEAVKGTIRAVAEKLANDQTDVRVGLVEYKDRTDAQVTRVFPFSSNLKGFAASVAELRAEGGGDTPEDMQAGLTAAIDQLDWRTDAVARLIVVIADAPPHLDYQDEKDYADSARRASARGIKMFTVSASGMDDTGQIVMRQMAQFTGASNMFVLRGGAGPQSVGGGDPKTSCGGTHDDYASGKLDQLILRKVKGELASLDADPMRIAGLGQDENAKPCKERLVMAN